MDKKTAIPIIVIVYIMAMVFLIWYSVIATEKSNTPNVKKISKEKNDCKALLDSIAFLNDQVRIYKKANAFARCGIYRYAVGHFPLEIDEFCFQVLDGAINAYPQEIEAKYCDDAYWRAASGYEDLSESGQRGTTK